MTDRPATVDDMARTWPNLTRAELRHARSEILAAGGELVVDSGDVLLGGDGEMDEPGWGAIRRLNRSGHVLRPEGAVAASADSGAESGDRSLRDAHADAEPGKPAGSVELPNLPSYDRLDGLVETDPIGLRDVAWGLVREVERLRGVRSPQPPPDAESHRPDPAAPPRAATAGGTPIPAAVLDAARDKAALRYREWQADPSIGPLITVLAHAAAESGWHHALAVAEVRERALADSAADLLCGPDPEITQRDEEIERLAAALKVCEHALHRTEPSDAEVHAAQQASGAWNTDWTPAEIADDLTDNDITAILGTGARG